jgi:hypothetical protein
MNALRTARHVAILLLLVACEKTPTVPSSPSIAPSIHPSADVGAGSIGFIKACISPTSIGAAYTCGYSIINLVSNTLGISGLSDVVHASGGDVSSGNILASLQLVLNGAASCTGGSGAGTALSPYVGATSCSLPAGASIAVLGFSHYTVQAGDYNFPSHQLTDEATLTWADQCTPVGAGCTSISQTATASSATVVQQLASSTASTIHNAAHQAVTTTALGATVHDYAAVTGQPGSPTPTGSVLVDWFTNSTCAGSPTVSSSSTTLVPDGTVDVIAFTRTPTTAGTFAFQARYSGDAMYAASTGPCEPLTVVDATIQIAPSTATNDVNGSQLLTGHVNINSGSGYVNAPDGVQIMFSITSGVGSFTTPSACTTSGGTGSCTVTLTSTVSGTTTVDASTSVSIAGVLVTSSTTTTNGAAVLTWVLPNPVLTVTKSCPSGKQSPDDRFAVVFNGTATGDVLDCGQSVNLTLQPATAFNVTEGASGTTTNLANYSAAYSGCQGTGLAAGATSTCTITNTLQPPHASALSAGYWKNHAARTTALLPISLGSYVVQDFTAAAAVFDSMDCGASKDLGAIGCLAGQLLAAKLNVKNGASNCVNSLIAQGDAILVVAGYQGSDQPLTTPLTSAQRRAADRLTAKLDRYNSGKGC